LLGETSQPLAVGIGVYFFAAAFLLAAQRALIIWESLLRPAGVIPPFLFAGVILPFLFAQRALAAAAIFARVAADILRFLP
jgi:hypothetical protein